MMSLQRRLLCSSVGTQVSESSFPVFFSGNICIFASGSSTVFASFFSGFSRHCQHSSPAFASSAVLQQGLVPAFSGFHWRQLLPGICFFLPLLLSFIRHRRASAFFSSNVCFFSHHRLLPLPPSLASTSPSVSFFLHLCFFAAAFFAGTAFFACVLLFSRFTRYHFAAPLLHQLLQLPGSVFFPATFCAAGIFLQLLLPAASVFSFSIGGVVLCSFLLIPLSQQKRTGVWSDYYG